MATTPAGDFPPLGGDESADVVVVGAGITGLTTARLLVEQGASVTVIDAGPVCAGATGNTTAKITSLHGLGYQDVVDRFDIDRARLYGTANEAAIAEIARLVDDDGIDCAFERRAHVAYTTEPDRAERVQREADLAAQIGLPAAVAETTELPFDVAAAVRFDHQAQFHPRAYCLGLAAAIVAGGGRIHAHTRALRIDSSAHTVVTTRGTLSAPSIVVATHLPIRQMGGYFARTEASRSYAIAVAVDGERPVDMYLGLDDPTRSLRTAGDHLVVGGEGHKVGASHDTTIHYRNLEAWAQRHFSVRGVTYRWSAQDWAAADGIPYIGRMAGGGSGIYVATAFKKWGMTHGTIAAMMIRDLIGGVDNPWLEVFDATRIAPRQSAQRVIAANADVVKHFVGDRFGARHKDLEDIAPDHGVVVRVGGRPVAAYRDRLGALSTVSAVCTHLGCLVQFNSAERSWDCPCHGSRFGTDGTMIEGPATDDLPQHEI